MHGQKNIKVLLLLLLLLFVVVCCCCFDATAPVCQGLLINEVSRSHTTTHHTR